MLQKKLLRWIFSSFTCSPCKLAHRCRLRYPRPLDTLCTSCSGRRGWTRSLRATLPRSERDRCRTPATSTCPPPTADYPKAASGPFAPRCTNNLEAGSRPRLPPRRRIPHAPTTQEKELRPPVAPAPDPRCQGEKGYPRRGSRPALGLPLTRLRNLIRLFKWVVPQLEALPLSCGELMLFCPELLRKSCRPHIRGPNETEPCLQCQRLWEQEDQQMGRPRGYN